ncbi:thiamine-phosphate kinase [Effusibacillus consociatus]|uniref:Thiamine-monophosphate kinase n=1 Tax=Effusibacillus consociatus TaxID=1117041 RepID=A0ABV9PXA4_9BACL
MNLREVGEFGLIERLRDKLNPADDTVIVGIGDDAAVLSYDAKSYVVMTTDMLVEGVHFREDTIDFRSLGWKSLAASFSDIAAMGGIPRHAAVSLAIPPSYEIESLEQLYEGIAEICSEFQAHVVGGDIVKTDGPFVISVTVNGEAAQGKALLRSGAQPGDLVFVTGTVGGSAAGLVLLESSQKSLLPPDEQLTLITFHQRPVPQVQVGQILRTSGGCTSCNDISDGLASELNEIAAASGVGIRIDENRLPLAPAVTNFARITGQNAIDWALYGGEDYQLVGTLHPLAYSAVVTACQMNGIRFTLIGRVIEGSGVVMERSAGGETVLTARGYNHFTE